MLRDNKDDKVEGPNVEVWTGRKWAECGRRCRQSVEKLKVIIQKHKQKSQWKLDNIKRLGNPGCRCDSEFLDDVGVKASVQKEV